MITEWTIYWLTRLDGIHDASYFLAFALLGFGLFASIGYPAFSDIFQNDEGKKSRMIRLTVRLQVLSFAFGLMAWIACLLTPSTKEMAAIIVIPRIANSQTVKEIGTSVVDLAKEWIEELHPPKREGSR